MKGRSWAVLSLLMLTSAGLAGCIEGFDSLSADDKGITAKQDRDLADNAAAAWNPEAFLIAAVGAETQDERSNLPPDVEVGDGRTPFWYYAYGAPGTQETRLFRVTADGRVTIEERLPGILGGMRFPIQQIHGWELDSDAAVAAAIAHPDFVPVAQAANASLVEAIGMHPELGRTTWIIGAFSDEGLAMALVDPTTGAVQVERMDVPEMPSGIPAPMAAAMAMPVLAPPVHIADEGTLDSAESERRYAFDAQAGMSGILTLDVDAQYPFDVIEVSLLDASGHSLWGLRQRGGPGDHEFTIPEDGGYELVVRLTSQFSNPFLDMPNLGSADFRFDMLVGHGIAPMPSEDEDES